MKATESVLLFNTLQPVNMNKPVHEMESTPGPKYSTIAPVPPFTVRIPATFRMISMEREECQKRSKEIPIESLKLLKNEKDTKKCGILN